MMESTSTEGAGEYTLLKPSFTPVGTILGHGSTGLVMTEREWMIATYVSIGYGYKKIAPKVGLTMQEVGMLVNKIGERIPGDGLPRTKLLAWMWTYGSEHYYTNRIPDRPRGRPPKKR